MMHHLNPFSNTKRIAIFRRMYAVLLGLLILTGIPTTGLSGTFTVDVTQSAGNPEILAYNIGHFLEQSNVHDWWRYSGVNGARMFLNPKEIESSDDIPGVGDGVTDQASFLSRRDALRADPLNTTYIDWPDFENEYENNPMGTVTSGNIFYPNYALGKLHDMGITVLAQISLPESRFPISDANDWAGKWELWQHFYAQAFYLSRHFDVHRFQMYNEPNHSNANGLTAESWLMRLQLASDAAQSAIADVNALYGKALEPLIYGPVNSGGSDVYSGSGWGDYAVANRHVNFLGETDPNFWLMHRYDYHEYNSLPSEFGANLSSLNSAMSADMSPETRFKTSISEFNVHTNGTFDTKTKTLDEASRYSRFGALSVQLAKNFMKEFYCFKFAQTKSDSGDTYPVKKNGMHYVQTEDAPHIYGGATKAAEIWRLFVKALKPGGSQLSYTRDADLTVLDQRATYDPGTDNYYVFSANYTTSDVNVTIDTSAWNLAAGAPFMVEEVSEAHSGGIRKWSTVSGDGTLFNETNNVFVQEAYTVLLFTIPAGSVEPEEVIAVSEDATVADGANAGNNYGADTSLTIRNDLSSADNRKAAYLKFNVPAYYAPDIQMAVLTLPAKTSTASANIQAHVYGLDDDSWSGNSVSWTSGPNLLQGVAAGNLIDNRVIDDQGNSAFIQGQLVVSDTVVQDKAINVTEFVRSQIGGEATFLISQDPRWDVTLPGLEVGDTQVDGIEINSSESGNGAVLRIVRLKDTDQDGLSDHAENNVFFTNPALSDSDGDGVPDGEEVANGMDPNDGTSPIQAEDFDAQTGTNTETCQDVGGGLNVSYISDGDWCRYDNVAPGSGAVFKARIARPAGKPDAQINVRLDSLTGTIIGSVDVPETGGWQSWQTVEVPVSDVVGTHSIFLEFVESGAPQGGSLFNANWFAFVSSIPGGLAATPVNPTQVDLSWNAMSGATEYHVKRSTTDGSGYVTVGSTATTSYSDTGLSSGTTYYYVVSAQYDGSESENSVQVSATTAMVYTLTYTAGSDGSISGTSPQNVEQGSDGTTVAAIPDAGYRFVNWSDSSTINPRTDTNVTGDITVTANFVAGELVAHWTMDDASGTTVADVSGNGNHATLDSGTWTAGFDAGALSFTGVDQVTLPASAFASVSDQITISMWVYGDASLPVNNVAFEGLAGVDRLFNIHLPYSNSQVYWDAGNLSGYDRINKTATAAEYKGQWNHWVFSKNASSGAMNIHVNGQPWHSASNQTRPLTGLTAAALGNKVNGSLGYVGLIDEVQIYNHALTDTAISNLYDSYVLNGAPTFTADPISTSDATEDVAYSDTLAGSATDPEADALTYSKVSGPAWLSVATDGSLYGTPSVGDIGLNAFIVQVDATGGSDTATLNITVNAAPDVTPPSAPTGLAANAGDATIALDWADNAESDLASYTVYRSTTSGSGYAPIVSGLVASDLQDSTVSNDTTYYYVVTASDTSSNESANSVEVSATPIQPNTDPVFSVDPIVGTSATEDTAYSGSIAGSATDADSDPLTYSKVSGPAWLSIASDGTLSGTPGSSDVGNNAFTVQVDDGNGGIVTAQLDIAVLSSGSTINVASGELTTSGSVSGSYADTTGSDNVYEALTEVESGGKPANRYSVLEHTWTISASGSSAYLYVEAYKSVSSDGDDFVFSYSTDGVNFTPAITITDTVDNDVAQGVDIGAVNGTVTIKVEDTDHTSGNNSDFDTVYVDSLFIETGGTPPANTPPVFSSDPFSTSNATESSAYSDSIAGSATDADSDPLTYSKVSGPTWLIIASDGTLSGTPSSADVGLNTFTVEVSDGEDTATATLEITVVQAGATPDCYVSDIAMSSGSYGGNRKSGIATITVLDDGSSPVANATVSVNWTGVVSGSDSSVTDGSGVVVIESSAVKGGGTFTVTVTDVTATGYNYNAALNVETSDSITN